MCLNFLCNLAQVLAAFQHYIKECVVCINTFQLAAFPSQRELAPIMRETTRKMWWLETEKGIAKPNSFLHNAFRGHARACGVPPDELILHNKWYSAKHSSLQCPCKPEMKTLESTPMLSTIHTLSQTHTHFHLEHTNTAHSENSGSSH